MSEQKPSRGLSGALVKLWRGGGDYELTVTGRTEITAHFLRLHFAAAQLLADRPITRRCGSRLVSRRRQIASAWLHPGQSRSGRRTVDIDFALHDGLATRWATEAAPGDVLEVTVLGSDFVLPAPAPEATSSSATPPRYRRSTRF